jgi:hypothetical protein
MPMPLRSSFRARKLRHKLNQLIRVMAPTLVALSFAGVAHAQGTMDFSGAQTLMGTFKTTLIMQLLRQIRDRGDVAIVHDPAGEFVQRFYESVGRPLPVLVAVDGNREQSGSDDHL